MEEARRSERSSARRPRRGRRRAGVAVAAVVIVLAILAATPGRGGDGLTVTGPPADDGQPGRGATTTLTSSSAPTSTATTTTTTTRPPFDGWVDPESAGQPFPKSVVEGLITFRGNPTRSWYGKGPVPRAPKVLWTYPRSGGMCAESSDIGGVTTWCGTGWNGQPSVWEREGRTWVSFGAYDRAVHFLDGADGSRIIPPLVTGDLAKGTVSVDPDGFPLVYHGSRDNYLRVVAFDRAEPTVLWRLSAYDVSPTLWNDDWDGAPLILGDYLFQGGENSRIHIVKLNRAYGPDGKVTVDPKLVWHAAGWDDELLAAIPDRMVSIESSVTVSGNTLYFANSGGLVQGWDISGLEQGRMPTRVFRFWTGDDTDATVVADAEGYLYVASEWERFNARSREVGQIMKLDPRRPDAPLVWSVKDQGPGVAGVWGTPAIAGDLLYVATHAGRFMGIDRADGRIVWEKRLPGPTWQSPVVVDDVLIMGDCGGVLRGYDISNPRVDPPQLWRITLEGCIESTPAVWKGRIYVGTRGGRFFALGDG